MATIAQDSFTRTVTSGWGTASEAGGAWATSQSGSGTATSDWNVTGSAGTIKTKTGWTHLAALEANTQADVDMVFDFSLSRLPTGSAYPLYVLGLLRTSSSGAAHYRIGASVTSTGASPASRIYLRAQTSAGTTVVANTDTGITAVVSTVYRLRIQAIGANPTTLRAKIWLASDSEPTSWLIDDSSNSSGPQTAGGCGIRSTEGDTTVTTISIDNILTGDPAGAINLILANASHATASSDITLVRVIDLSVDSSSHDISSPNLSLSLGPLSSVDNSSHGISSSDVSLVRVIILSVDNSSHAVSSPNVSLTNVIDLSVDNSSHAVSSPNATLVRVVILTVANSSHALSSDNLSLVRVVILTVASSSNATASPNLTLGRVFILVVGNTVHAMTSTYITAGVQFMKPDGDISVGTWVNELGTQSNLYQSINEDTYSDSDWIEGTGPLTVSLENATDPVSSDNHVVSYRVESVGGVTSLLVELLQGTTVIASKEETDLSSSYYNGSFTLTADEADSITDYNDLRLRFTDKEAGYPATVSTDGRYIIDQNGDPWLMFGDQILPALKVATNDNIETVFSNRKDKKFNAVWICLICDAYIGGNDDLTDYYSEVPFTGSDFDTPNETYWDRVDQIIDLAASYGITCCLTPIETAGNAMGLARTNGLAGCYTYGQFLGNRYKDRKNILWWHGNDYGGSSDWTSAPPSQSDSDLGLRILDGIKYAGDTHLHTAELNYNVSTTGDDGATGDGYGNWRTKSDLNMAYTYAKTYDAVLKAWLRITHDDALSQTARFSAKPVFMGEANYEGADNMHSQSHPATAFTLRCQNYWTVLAGGLGGQLWGNRIVHHFMSGWASNLDTAATYDAQRWATFFRSIPWHTLVTDCKDHAFLTGGYGTYVGSLTSFICPNVGVGDFAAAAMNAAGTLGVVFTPVNHGLVIDMTKFAGTVTARWFDPTNGNYTDIGTFPNTDTAHTFTPSATNSAGATDWVLLLEA